MIVVKAYAKVFKLFNINTVNLSVPQFLHFKNKSVELANLLGSFQFKNYVTLKVSFLGRPRIMFY